MSETSHAAVSGAAGAPTKGEPSATMRKVALALIGVGAVLSGVAVATDADRFGYAYLWAFSFVWTLAVGSLFLVALHHVTHSVWSVVVRRLAEGFMAIVPWLLVLVAPVLVFVAVSGTFTVFPWANADVVHGDHVLETKEPYLNLPFFAVRAVGFIAIWALFAKVFLGGSLRQDGGDAGEEATLRMRRWAAPFMLVFALTVTFASFDWLMSLDPHWFSTIFGVYIFSGMVLTALAVLTLSTLGLRARGRLGEGVVRPDHLYNLGALLFAFTCFWAYIAFSQYMLIWYGNLPEETVYFHHRMEHGWAGVTIALALVRFVIPFFVLLARGAKMRPRRLVIASVIVLAGQWLDLYWLIMPQVHRDAPRLSWQELGPPLLLSGVVILLFSRFLARHRPIAAGDPLYRRSCEFHL